MFRGKKSKKPNKHLYFNFVIIVVSIYFSAKSGKITGTWFKASIMFGCLYERNAANFYSLVSQSPNAVSKIANCFVETTITEKLDFEGNIKTISGFKHISSKIRALENVVLLNY